MTDADRRAFILAGITEHLDDVIAALEFYADSKTWETVGGYWDFSTPRKYVENHTVAAFDNGRLARVALGMEPVETTNSRQSVSA